MTIIVIDLLDTTSASSSSLASGCIPTEATSLSCTPRIRGDMADSGAASEPNPVSSSFWTASTESPGAAGLVDAMGREGGQRAVVVAGVKQGADGCV